MKLLDTDTCIGLLKGDDAVVAAWRSCGEQCALEEGLTLVTGNIRHYNRIEALAFENWFAR